MSGSPDTDIAAVCRTEERVIVTLDLDFADIRSYPPAEYSGIIVLRLQQQDKHSVQDVLERLITLIGIETLNNRLWIVDERRIRIRQ